MTKNLGRIAQLKAAIDGLYVFQKCFNVALEAATKELHDLEKDG